MKTDAENARSFHFLLVAVAGWMDQRQQQVIEYLQEENRVLREQLGDRRLRFNDDQRRRLAVRAKGLSRKLLAEVASLVTPDTLLAWHRKLIAPKESKRTADEMLPTDTRRSSGSSHRSPSSKTVLVHFGVIFWAEVTTQR
jgi:hypothetical protein